MNASPQNLRRTSTAVLLVSVLALSACASQPERRGPPQDGQGRQGGGGGGGQSSGTFMHPVAALFSSMDTNRDKRVSFEEVQSGSQAEWAGIGERPSATYFAKWSLETLGSTDAMPTFMSFDRDFNGVISEGEFSSQLEREFKRLDKNADNVLDRSEMIVAFAARQGERSRGGQEQGRGGRGQGGGQGGQGGGRPSR